MRYVKELQNFVQNRPAVFLMQIVLHQLESDDRFVSLALSGSLDMNSIASVDTRFLALTVSSGRDTIVDLSELTFISSLGIGLFVTATKGLKRNQARLVLYAPNENIRAVFAKAGLKDFLVVVSDIHEAQNWIGGPA